jgi:hypothetical protein
MTEPLTTTILYKEIDLIQACISRMAQNSFMVKGWLITLIAVVLALLPESFDIRGLCIVGLVTSPISNTNNIFEKQKIALTWQLSLLVATLIVFYISKTVQLNIINFLYLFSSVSFMLYLTLYFIMRTVSKGEK